MLIGLNAGWLLAAVDKRLGQFPGFVGLRTRARPATQHYRTADWRPKRAIRRIRLPACRTVGENVFILREHCAGAAIQAFRIFKVEHS